MSDMDFGHTERVVKRRAELAAKALFSAVQTTKELDIDGEACIIEVFVGPRLSEDNEWEFGYDVKAKDGSWHLEFWTTNSGWGATPVQSIQLI